MLQLNNLLALLFSLYEVVFLHLDSLPYQWFGNMVLIDYMSLTSLRTQEMSLKRVQLSLSLSKCGSRRRLVEKEWIMSDCFLACGLWQPVYVLSLFQ